VRWRIGAVDEGERAGALGSAVRGRRRSVHAHRREPKHDNVDGES
jgi:hypothetical protein